MRIFLIFLWIFINCACSTRIKEQGNKAQGLLDFKVSDSWQRVNTSNSMRQDQYLVDPTSGTEMLVFFFPDMTNLVAQNLERWRSQFWPNDREELRMEKLNFNNLAITVFEMRGTFLKARDMMDPQSPKDPLVNYSLLAAIIETQKGSWVFKILGPQAIIAKQRANFDYLLRTCKVQ